MIRLFVALSLVAHIGCKTYSASGVAHKDRAWASERTSFLGFTLSEKLYYCYAEEQKAQPVCIEAEFISAEE